ncbi:rRNA-processing protein bfr2 [Tulasnella sp. 403]|nr:rRNA-processing protein bfr2 [Tulasnella sp. 403]
MPHFDPEDAYNFTKPNGFEGDELELEEAEAARDHYLDVGPSSLRNQQDIPSDSRYGGVKTSRTKIFDDDDSIDGDERHFSREKDVDASEEASSGDGDSEVDDYQQALPFGDANATPSLSDTDQGLTEGNDEVSEQGRPTGLLQSTAVDEGTRQLAETLRQGRKDDRRKGKAIAKQMGSRGHPEQIYAFHHRETRRDVIGKFLQVSLALSDDLYRLQEIYISKNEDLTVPPRKKRKLEPSSSLNEYKTHIGESSAAQSDLEASLHRSVLQTLLKWSQKVQAVAPSALLSTRTTFKDSARQFSQQKTAVDLIEETLATGKPLSRTRIRRAGDKRRVNERDGCTDAEPDHSGVQLPSGGPETLDADEVYDDTDFYQQLLRDVIESRSGRDGSGDQAVSDAWARKQKKARKAERALSNKDRRIRYDVHEKLQNFMVPVPVSRGAWHEEQVDELFSSLLGKGFEGIAQEEPKIDNSTSSSDVAPKCAVRNGLLETSCEEVVGHEARGSRRTRKEHVYPAYTQITLQRVNDWSKSPSAEHSKPPTRHIFVHKFTMGNILGHSTQAAPTVKIVYEGKKRKIRVDPGPPVSASGNLNDLFQGSEQELGRVALKRCRLPVRGKSKEDIELRETADALAYLHAKGYFHGDIKAQNVLVSSDHRALLCDFRLSRPRNVATAAGLKGLTSLRFQCPEIWQGASRTEKSDVYAFGMMIYQVLAGAEPFAHLTTHAALLRAIVVDNQRPPCAPKQTLAGEDCSRVWALAEKCWRTEHERRPLMKDVHLALKSA